MIGLLLLISPTQAQRLLGDEIGIQVSGAIPMKSISTMDKDFGFQLAIVSNTASGNYWKFGMEYQHKTFDYKKRQLPYEYYNGNIGYFLQALSNHRKSVLVYVGISGVAGYEVFNKNTALLQDGATLKNTSGFVYGGKAALSLEIYLSNRWVLFGFSEITYLPKSGLSKWRSQFGIGTRIFIN